MITQRKIRSLRYCRSCLNQVTGLELRREDVYAEPVQSTCRRCGDKRFLITGVSSRKRWQLMSARIREK